MPIFVLMPFPCGIKMKHIQTVVVISILLCACACSRNPQARRDKFLQSGNRYFEKGKYPEAAIEYRSAVQADAKSAEAHERLATAYMKVSSWEGAVKELERTVELQPNNTGAQLNLGNILFAGQDLEQAGQIGFALLQQDPNN